MTRTAAQTGQSTARDEVRPRHSVVDYGRGRAALRAMRDEVAVLSELSYDGMVDRFASRISTFHLSSALLLEAQVPKVRYDRSPLRVARSGIDHYLVVVYLHGCCRHRIACRCDVAETC